MKLLNSIPKVYEDGFNELNSLSKAQFDEIKKVLSKLKWTSTIQALANKVESKKLGDVDIFGIFESVGSLVPYLDTEQKIPIVIEDIIFLIQLNKIFKIQNQEGFREKLTFFLTNKHIYYASKSEDLIDNFGNVYILSRVISDIRTVFEINIEKEPKAGFIIHNLSIHYQANEEPYHKDISIQLTSIQIKELKETLERAEKKERVLKNVFEKSEFKNLNE